MPNAHLTVHRPNLLPQQLSLPPHTITLGRAVECTVPIRDRFLSRMHAEISYDGGRWVVRDLGSVNGTLLNGVRLSEAATLRPGDRIGLGDTEVVFEPESIAPSQLISVDSSSQAKSIAIRAMDVMDETALHGRERERASVLAQLAIEFIEDRPLQQLFDFILDRVVDLFDPSRAALALLDANRQFSSAHLRRRDAADSADLIISKTLLGEVIEERSVVSFVDTSHDDKLARAESIIGQQIRSAVCAPLLVRDNVLGVLYLDFLAQQGMGTTDDLKLIAQIARFAAAKLETTRLREEATAKARMDEELRTAYTIQSRLLPAELPVIDGYLFAARNKPCRTVSGDYYDVVVRPSGRIYFVIADVSGKGITAALVMASLATAFDIFTRTDPTPAELVRRINETLAPRTAPTRFVTLFAAVLDPATGVVDYANAGHVPPLVISNDGARPLTITDMVVGLFPAAKYRDQQVRLLRGDSLVLFTDGVTEAENAAEEQLGLASVTTLLDSLAGTPAPRLVERIESHVQTWSGGAPAGDDVTMLALTRT
ncbi:MAG TPA: SpoIIE family protein phosphatase [Thermoanaerobaculia bacterium]|nr:SpoIIE family protein phosphatase [Thermoanaerobaculia bacterium]